MKKVLIITYFWPPAGGPGVQRVLKFVKYLPAKGWQPIILTVENGEYPILDKSLMNNIPAECKVYRTKSLEPFTLYKKFLGLDSDQKIPTAVLAESSLGLKKRISNWIRLNLFIPDAKIGWKYFAVKVGLKIINSERPLLIFSSSPPPTVHLIAKALAKKSNLKWVADFRDPWTDIHYYENQPRLKLANKLDLKSEMNVLNSADLITCISKLDIEEDFGKKTKSGKCIHLPNGYDEDDFVNVNVHKTNKNVFTILHLGTVNKERYPTGLIRAIRNMKESGYIDSTIFQFLFIGKVEQEVQKNILDEQIGDLIQFIDYLPHKKALKYTEQASMLILLITNSRKNKRILPGKTFEYLRAEKFILSLGPKEGEVERILEEVRSGEVVGYEDHKKIEKIIKQQFNAWHKDVVDYMVNNDAIKRYSRENLTRQLAGIFDNLSL